MFSLVPLTESAVEEIVEWRYDPPYHFYDVDADPEEYAEFVDSKTWDDKFAVEDDSGDVVGFFTFDSSGDAITVGLGMRPEWTGEGLGAEFVTTGLEFAAAAYDCDRFELAVASFNERARSVYEAVGFETVETFEQETNGGAYEFVRMRRD
ncbi:GNAT family N-acetyltransferase [Haloferax sp. YSSS75]|uniref:GNAT family N-acetyltransferase n=1 Tax=Haloferax sp. YSSS75 TaxID=3388564 RepID=UPI00398D5129